MKRIFSLLLVLVISALPVLAENLCENAEVIAVSGYMNEEERPEFLVDGDPDTKWCSGADTVTNTSMQGSSEQFITLDLGDEVTFDSYTLRGAGDHGRDFGNHAMNPREWILESSSDGNNWDELSHIEGNTDSDTTVELDSPASARFIRLLMIKTTQTDENCARLYELEFEYSGAHDGTADTEAQEEAPDDSNSGDGEEDGSEDKANTESAMTAEEKASVMMQTIFALAIANAAIAAILAVVFASEKRKSK